MDPKREEVYISLRKESITIEAGRNTRAGDLKVGYIELIPPKAN